MNVAALRLGRREFAVQGLWRPAVLLLAVAMFGQVFHYVVDIPPTYYLSKAWPVLMAPFALLALLRGEPPFRLYFLVLLAWVVTVPLITSVIYFGQPILGGIGTLAKTFPISYALSFAGLLLWLRPEPAAIARSFVWLGYVTFALMLFLWLVVPAEAYRADEAGLTKLFLWDQDRGERIYMPMYFGAILMLYQFRRGLDGHWLSFVVVGICYVLLIVIFKQRVTLAALAGTMVIAAFLHSRRWRLVVLAGAAVGLLLAVPLVLHFRGVAAGVTASFGGSLSVRQESVQIAFDFLNESFFRWLIGVGTLARINDMTLQTFFHAPNFYLADIGWLGIAFEYGLIGTVLLAGLYLLPLLAKRELVGPRPGPFLDALGDYMIYLVLASGVYSIIFAPGEAATIFAIFAYINLLRREAGHA